jgi:PAS domain S-box-containing protein
MDLPANARSLHDDPMIDDITATGATVLRALASRCRQRGQAATASAQLVDRLEAAAVLLETGHLTDVDDAGADRRVEMEALRQSEERFRLMVEAVRDYAIFTLDPGGHITSWNTGAEHLKGYRADEILGKHFSIFYTKPDRDRDHPQDELARALADGSYQEEGFRIRKDGSQFWANVTITSIHEPSGRHVGFVKVTRDMTERKRAEEALQRANEELRASVRRQAVANQEIEAFSYAVSHDLRAPLRALDGFSRLLLEQASERLEPTERDYLARIRAASQQMSQLIDAMLGLSRLTRAPIERVCVDLSAQSRAILASLEQAEPAPPTRWRVAEGLEVTADPRLLRVALENLLRNAWKFTRKAAAPAIEVGVTDQGSERVFFVRDNGAGFDMSQAHRLFQPFQRLHRAKDFEGTGLGLVTVNRILQRHGGRIWVDSTSGQGTTFYFTVGAPDVP